jgi:hypothetical protein
MIFILKRKLNVLINTRKCDLNALEYKLKLASNYI